MLIFFLSLSIVSHICASVFLAKPRFNIIITILAWATYGVVFLTSPKVLGDMSYHFTLVLNFLLFLLLTKGRIIEKGFLFLSYVSLYTCTSAIINCFIFGQGNTVFQISLTLLAIGIMQYVLYGIYVPAFRKVSPYIDREWIKSYAVVLVFFLLILVQTVIPELVVEMDPRSKVVFLTTVVAFLITSVSMFSGMNDIVELAKEKRKKTQMELLFTQVESQKKEVETARRNRHDIRHHYQMLLAYVKHGAIDEAIDYLEKQSEQIDQEAPHRFCEDDTINNILHVYLKKAETKQIPMEVSIDLTQPSKLSAPDFVAILANVAENAVHGAEGVHNRQPWISMKLYNKEGKFVINCENACDPSLEFQDMPVERYGIGINSIITTAEKYNASYRFSASDGVFKCLLIMDT